MALVRRSRLPFRAGPKRRSHRRQHVSRPGNFSPGRDTTALVHSRNESFCTGKGFAMQRSLFSLVFLVFLVFVGACSGPGGCLTEPGCADGSNRGGQQVKEQAPLPAAVLELASFSMVYYRSVTDDECFAGCERPVIEVIETGKGRASIGTITVWGFRAGARTNCIVEPGQRRPLDVRWFNPTESSTVGQERTILVTYNDGAGQTRELTGRTLVTTGAEPTNTSDTCVFP